MKTYHTKLEAYKAGREDQMSECAKHEGESFRSGLARGIAQERARAKKKLNPLYNRPVSLKERVDREAEAYIGWDTANDMADSTVYLWKGLGKTKQPSLWSRFVKFINPKQYLM